MSPIAQTVPLGPQWPTVDPFLFCAHHLDHYPAGTDELGPDPTLLPGRDLGMDFAGRDGWNMYHGQVVPGFPAHPHRGFETVTYVRTGIIDHSDSLGATARFGRGDVQWMTAGAGVVHAEMFPLLNRDQPNPLELFQIWLNLPAADKMVPAHFSMLWGEGLPRVQPSSGAGGDPSVKGAVEVTVVAGPLEGHQPPPPPPHSWASRPEADVAIWHAELGPGGAWTLPPAASDRTLRTLYLFEGGPLVIDGGDDGGQADLAPSTGAVLADSTHPVTIRATDRASCLILQGRPIGEPVARHGPFVMNSRDEIMAAFTDYERTRFGGWPWPADDHHHGPDQARFAHHADGRLERPPTSSETA